MGSPSAINQEMGPSALPDRGRAVVPLLMSVSFLGYVNRVSIATAGDARIMAQYDLTPTRMGVVYSAFLFTYTCAMIPSGLFIDRVRPRMALLTVLATSAVFVALTGFVGVAVHDGATAFATLLVVRGLMGIVSAPLYPACAAAVSEWVVAGRRSRSNGLVTGSALVGVAVTPAAFGALIDRIDWPGAFWLAAVLTFALAALWARRAPPDALPRRARSERMTLDSRTPCGKTPPGPPFTRAEANEGGPASDTASTGAEPKNSPSCKGGARGGRADRDYRACAIQSFGAPGAPGWQRLLDQRSLILLTLSYGAVGYFQYLFFYWMTYYFERILELPPTTSRGYAAVPPLAMALGMPLGGWLSDRLEQSFGRRRARRIVPASGMFTGGLLLAIGVFAHEPVWIVAWFSLALGAVGAAEGPFWLTAVELGGRNAGRSAAIFNTGGNAGGLIAPVVTPWVGQLYGWPWAVGLGAVVCFLGVVLWLGIDPDHAPREAGPPAGQANQPVAME